MSELALLIATCRACQAQVEPVYVGTASGRPHYECACGAKWVGKNPAAAALGRLGARALNKSLNGNERTASAEKAANARWRRKKLAGNVAPSKSGR